MNEKLKTARAARKEATKAAVLRVVDSVRDALEARGWRVQIRPSGHSVLCKRPDGARVSIVLRDGFDERAMRNGLLNVCKPEPSNPATEAMKDWSADSINERRVEELEALIAKQAAVIAHARDILIKGCLPDATTTSLCWLAERVTNVFDMMRTEAETILGQANIPTLIDQRDRALADLAEVEGVIQRLHDADMRGIKMWQQATGKDMAWPDQGKLVVWLLEQLEVALTAIDAWRELNEVAKEGEFNPDLVLMLFAQLEKTMAEALKIPRPTKVSDKDRAT